MLHLTIYFRALCLKPCLVRFFSSFVGIKFYQQFFLHNLVLLFRSTQQIIIIIYVEEMCLTPCLVKSFWCLNVLLQSLHWKVFSSVWDILWLCSSLAETKLLSIICNMARSRTEIIAFIFCSNI